MLKRISNYQRYILRENVLYFGSLSILLVYSMTMTTAYFLKSDETVLIGVDKNGTRIISRNDDPLLKIEVVNFLKEFSYRLYNFDRTSFIESVGLATELMSNSLWEKEKGDLLRKSEDVSKEDIKVSSVVTKISRLEDGFYRVELDVIERRKLSKKNRKIDLDIQLNSTDRSKLNPWGLEVEAFREASRI